MVSDAEMLAVQGKIDDDKHEDGLVKQASGEGPAKDKDEPEVRRLSVAPTLKRRSSSTLSSIADLDLAELSLLDVLTQAAADVLGSIPAQRCIVYIYDKAANLLRPQVVVDCHDREVDEGGTPEGKQTETIKEDHSCSSIETSHGDANGEQKEEGEVKSPLVSFPPVVGMVSSSFLQRRCLRMQEPNPVCK
ncbi:unnamed protein product [Phytophthora lilii]|uniref:Unnamed protein product n=1 Tax=Phytophthora lilii TaxID=2077276 RepID=A0A9W6THV5_9STRA|nr:unnamed protein product [Phytophthora lilii]